MPFDLAIHTPDLARLNALLSSPDLRRSESPWMANGPSYSRLYFGSEFCQHLLPSTEELQQAAELAMAQGWSLTLLTSYSTDAFVEQTVDLVATALAAIPDGLEVVVNDWGLLRRLGAEFGSKVTRVLGRGLNRMMRDPRVPDVGPEHLGGDALPGTWQQGSMHSRGFTALLERLGVGRIESDVPLTGLAELPPSALATTLHAPWGMVASGRVCLVNAWGKPGALRFVPPMHCDAPCRRFSIELRAPWSRRDSGSESLPLVADGAFIPLTRLLNRRRNVLPEPATDPAPRFFQKGNTHFYRLSDDQLAALYSRAETSVHIDRLVVAPDLPM
jgi:hypothetical protein